MIKFLGNLIVFVTLAAMSMTGCGNIVVPGQHLTVTTNIKPCLQSKYDGDFGLTLGVEQIKWQDKLVKFGIDNLPKSQKRMLEQQFTWIPQDKFIVFDVYLENRAQSPVTWNPRNAPVFALLDKKGTMYNASGQNEGNMDDISAKIMIGATVNPGRKLRGTVVFDVPRTDSYVLLVKQGKWTGGWSVIGGNEFMRCNVDS
ncbi:MAG: DUF4352 domain-containing protein [Magnetococcales bacterium]|nr:DUF4352 domain-containing protein [Magnetococcales bacterium]